MELVKEEVYKTTEMVYTQKKPESIPVTNETERN